MGTISPEHPVRVPTAIEISTILEHLGSLAREHYALESAADPLLSEQGVGHGYSTRHDDPSSSRICDAYVSCGVQWYECLPSRFFCWFSETRVVVVSLLVPIIMRLCVGIGHPANLFDLFDPVFERCDQTQRSAMVGGQRLAVQLVGEQGLRM
jgi:hypothetical protein